MDLFPAFKRRIAWLALRWVEKPVQELGSILSLGEVSLACSQIFHQADESFDDDWRVRLARIINLTSRLEKTKINLQTSDKSEVIPDI